MTTLLISPPTILAFLGVMILLVLLTDLFAPHAYKIEVARIRAHTYCLVAMTLGVLAIWMLVLYPKERLIFFEGHFIWDALSAFLGCITVITSALAFTYAQDDLSTRQIPTNDYYLLGLCAVFGMLVLNCSRSVLSLYLGLELMSLPLYAMVALERHQVNRAEAAMKYIIGGAVASAFFLYGSSLIYLNSSFVIGAATMHMPLLTLVGMVLVVAAIAFKLGVAPFHFWVPDVYEGAPIAVGALIATAPKIAVIGVALRIFTGNFPGLYVGDWSHLLTTIGLFSIILGNLAALVQTHIRRLLAYSSIAHMGYVLLSLTIQSTGSAIAIFYGTSYILMTAAAFGVLAALQKLGIEIESISDFRGLGGRQPALSFILSLTLFSMAGIPPFLGFFTKLGVLQVLLENGQMLVAGIALCFTTIGVYYYVNLIKSMYFESAQARNAISNSGLLSSRGHKVVGINAMLLLILGLSPDCLVTLCRKVVIAIV